MNKSQADDPRAPMQTFDPQVVTLDCVNAVADEVAGRFADAITQNPEIVLGLATGGSPVGTYERLVRKHQAGRLSFAELTTFNLDEYVGLAPDHPQSFRHFMRAQLFDHVDVDPERTHVPAGITPDVASHCADYERLIESAGGIDLQLLGIGSNGHIAFNEPGSAVDSVTRQVDLTSETIQANSRFFDSVDQVPTTAITMGIGTILRARRIVVIAFGENKADAVACAITSTPSADCPASWLRHHRDVTFVLDRDASSGL